MQSYFILDLLDEVKACRNAKGKKELIARNVMEYDYLYTTLFLALNDKARFGVTLSELQVNESNTEYTDLMDVYDYIYDFDTQESTPVRTLGSRKHLRALMEGLHPKDYEVAVRVINKDLNIGMSAKSVNAAFKEAGLQEHHMIPYFEPMKAKKEKEYPITKLKFPAVAQLKMDAARAFLVYDHEESRCYFLSSTGKEAHGFEHITETLKQLLSTTQQSWVLDGELIMTENDGKDFAPRKKSNGKFNSAIHGSLDPNIAGTFVFVVWDLLQGNEELLYKGSDPKENVYYTNKVGVASRFDSLQRLIKAFDELVVGGPVPNPIRLVETKSLHHPADVSLYAAETIKAGEEGIVVKNTSFPYEPKRSGNWIKVKKSAFADVRVTGVNEGKNAGTLGSLSYETDDGKVAGDVSGISDSDKARWWAIPDDIIGHVIEVSYMEVSENKQNPDLKTLYGPANYIRERFDKTTTNNLEDLE